MPYHAFFFSGAFSVARQTVQMGLLPRMMIVHTSGKEEGQIYVPFTNWTLFVAVIALVIGFKSSSNLAAAYGLAVTGTMLIDTVLVSFVMVLIWRWHLLTTAAVIIPLLLIDIAFFSANALKIPDGGWFPLAIGAVSFIVLTTWRKGRQVVGAEISKHSMPMDAFISAIDDVHRVSGTAVFMTSAQIGVPSALLHNLKHNQILHERVVLMTIETTDTPTVRNEERVSITDLGKGFLRIIVRYGFMENPEVPKALQLCEKLGVSFDMMSTTFYLARESVVPAKKSNFAIWRGYLFKLMSKNATSATDFFKIPANRVVELGAQLVI